LYYLIKNHVTKKALFSYLQIGVQDRRPLRLAIAIAIRFDHLDGGRAIIILLVYHHGRLNAG
jgi:hypothetical protein